VQVRVDRTFPFLINYGTGIYYKVLSCSIVESAKENLNPYSYLIYLFEQLPNMDIQDKAVLDPLFPGRMGFRSSEGKKR
jgi:hypothetical protein